MLQVEFSEPEPRRSAGNQIRLDLRVAWDCGRLEVLHLNFCGRGVDDISAKALASAGTLQGLTSLELCGAYKCVVTHLHHA